MTKAEITTIYNYCIGGFNMPFNTMKSEVISFMKNENLTLSDLEDEIGELKRSEHRELELAGYYDY